MSTKKLAYLLAFSIVLGSASPALATKSPTPAGRYFVKTKKVSLWKSGITVRHLFADGFTADLSDWQLRLTKLFGIDVEPVQKLSILPADEIGTSVEVVSTVVKDTEGEDVRIVPTEQVPWGVKAIADTSAHGKEVIVAVLDTGVDTQHPDLVDRIDSCKDFTALKPPFIDGSCEDRNGHGTHVAGIIAADGGSDDLGIYGIAPLASISAFKVCDVDGVCFADDVATAIRTAVDDGAQIITMSVGADTPSSLIADAVTYANDKNVFVVAASGNDGPYAGSIDYPAAFAGVVAVGAVDDDLIVPDWSSRGDNNRTKGRVIEEGDLEFVAPGVNIESTWKNGEYAILSGTSMAAPHIAGLAARLWDAKAKNPAQAVREKLYELTHDILPAGEDDDSGYGLPMLGGF